VAGSIAGTAWDLVHVGPNAFFFRWHRNETVHL